MCDSDAKFGGKDGTKTPFGIFVEINSCKTRHPLPNSTPHAVPAGLVLDTPIPQMPLSQITPPHQTLLQKKKKQLASHRSVANKRRDTPPQSSRSAFPDWPGVKVEAWPFPLKRARRLHRTPANISPNNEG